jgi:thiol-disulfide isomerase/thioredoxin
MESTSSLLAAIRGRLRPPGRGPAEGRLPSLDGALAWLNSPTLTPSDLRGRVVVVQFWTFTCINWLRTAPYVRAWAEAYRDAGAVVLGIHTPEFGFEGEVDNVRRAIGSRRITYPVAVDSNYAIWTAFANMYWPALYVADAEGQIRYHHFGEGAYEESEEVIRNLLAEAGAVDTIPEPVTVEARDIEAPADWDTLRSPETYLGLERGDAFASPGGADLDASRTYEEPARLELGQWALAGDWTVRADAVTATGRDGRIAFRFHARDLNLVMGPRPGVEEVRFRVLIDGRPPDGDQGVDVDDQGRGTAGERDVYQLVRQRRRITDRTAEIEFLDPGIEAFVVTFG